MSSTTEPHNDLKSLLTEALELRNVNHEKLSQITGISERYIWAIQNGEFDKLPSLPYVRGYIKKIAEVLRLNHDEIWDLYKKELTRKTSGKYDTLPENRFAIRELSRKQIFALTLGALFVFYLLFNISRLLGTPDLLITEPAQSIATTSENHILLTGTLTQQDKLTINGSEIFVNADNTFSKDFPLQPGLNVIEFKAQRFLGRETDVTKQILYQPTAAPVK